MKSITKILMERDGLTTEEANDLICEAKEDLNWCLEDGDLSAAENICQTHFGLEPDYLDQLY